MKEYDTQIPRYVGITDFTNSKQAFKMRWTLAQNTVGMRTPPVLMVGIMMSFKTLWGIPCKWTDVFPRKEEIDAIFPPYEEEGFLNTLHYADFEDQKALPHERTLFFSLAKALDYAKNCHAVQLDMTWPDPGVVASAIQSARRPIGVILQIGREALKQADYDPATVVRYLEDYVDVVDGVLLDQSMGEGKLMEPEILISYMNAISRAHPKMHLAVAGGLDPSNLEILVPLLKAYPNLSIDAQAGLRRNRDPKIPIDWLFAAMYTATAGQLFKKYRM